MKRIFNLHTAKWAAITLAVLLVAMQFIPIDRTNPPVETEIPASAEVRAILKRACYSCHSNETVWPTSLYGRIAPSSLMVALDVSMGRKELNFSTWNRMPLKKLVNIGKAIHDEVDEGGMPPWRYLSLHPEARLSDRDRAILRVWAQSMSPVR